MNFRLSVFKSPSWMLFSLVDNKYIADPTGRCTEQCRTSVSVRWVSAITLLVINYSLTEYDFKCRHEGKQQKKINFQWLFISNINITLWCSHVGPTSLCARLSINWSGSPIKTLSDLINLRLFKISPVISHPAITLHYMFGRVTHITLHKDIKYLGHFCD